MSEQSRKVKNPLLTAAGQGFPFEGYSTNALLMPVTPATPAILPDDIPVEGSLAGGPISGNLPQLGISTEIGFPSVQDFGTIPQQTDVISREPPSQPQRQSYFTSILSSLPNLSLSTITGDAPAPTPVSQQPAGPPNPGGPWEPSPYGLAQNPYGPLSISSAPFVAVDQPRDPSTQYSQGYGDIGVGAPPTSSPSPRLPPTAAALPPLGGPGSYRLGNQRRLKYAPPPDLTSNTPKQYPAPPVSSFLPPVQQQNVSQSTSDFLIPSGTFQTASTGYTFPGSISSPNLQSGQIGGAQSSQTVSSSFSAPSVPDIQQQGPPPSSIAQSSFQARQYSGQQNPVISGWSGPPDSLASAPQEIPSRFPETATPQNTPANATFGGFASIYAGGPATTLISSGRDEARVSAGFTSAPGVTKFSEGLTFDVPSSAFPRSNIGPISGAIIEPNISSSTEDTPLASATVEDKSFTPISAARVTAKLEHLLAEREEDSSPVKSAVKPFPVTTEQAKSPVHLQQQQPIVTSSDHKQRALKSETSEDLAEIDLSTNDSFPSAPPIQDSLLTSHISGGDFAPALGSESFARSGSRLSTPADTNVSSKSSSIADFFAQNQSNDSVTSASNFFTGDNQARKSELNYFSSAGETPSTLHSPPQAIQSPRTANSLFNPGPSIPATNAPSPFLTSVANSQQISPSTVAQSIPTFYNPGPAPSTWNSPYSVFTPQAPTSGPSVPNPFSTALGSGPPSFPISESFMATTMPEPTGSATLNPVQMSVNPGIGRGNSDMVPPSLQTLAAGPADRRMQYRPVYHHWFYRKEVETKVLWLPFSMQDSLSLEEVHNSSEITPETTVATDGGRYDVDILRRRRSPVYWTGTPAEVRRSSWFYQGSAESRYIPYEENTSARLEEEYKHACSTDNWNRRIELSNGEYIIFHTSTMQIHYGPATSPELAASWGNSAVSPALIQTTSAASLLPILPNIALTNFVNPLRTAYARITQGSETGTYLQGAASRPKVVKRGVDEFNIDEGEPDKVDHLLFLVHGIGSVCDLKFRTVEEVVDEFRSISLQLVQSHYRTASMHGVVNRIEVLPISWHTTLHSEDTGIDKKLKAITLESIPKLRHFTNDTLLDILFYTSPIYCQTIMQTVGNEMNRLYTLFKARNSNFQGSVYLGGHSLGSLIVFDLLCHQKPPAEESRDEMDPNLLNPDSKSDDDTVTSMKTMVPPVLKRRLSKKVSYVMGAAGTGQPFINYPQLSFLPKAFFALGSPIGMFVTVRGIDTLGDDFVLPTCPAFFNVFHPFDPVAYRVEALINPDAHKYRPMLIPHHKGRKRMHLELKETMARVGADLKQKLLDSVRSTWNSVYQLAMFHRPDNSSLEQEIEKVVEEQLHKSPSVPEQQNDDDGGADFRVGKLNGGRRIDYVLQEAPFEYINEYIFALTSHVCYWESEDTMLMILKEIYGTNGIQTDAQLPPQTMTIERVSPSPSIPSMSGVASTSRRSGATTPVGIDPTSPITTSKPVGPPPITGFVRKS